MDGKRYQKGLGVIGWILLMPFILIGLVVVGFIACEANKSYWDGRVAEMCNKNDRVIVYQAINITKDQAIKLRGTSEFIGIGGTPDFLVYAKSGAVTIINPGFPKVSKVVSPVIESSTGMEIGKIISYHRSGGDFPTGIMHPSSFSCPKGVEYYREREKFFNVVE